MVHEAYSHARALELARLSALAMWHPAHIKSELAKSGRSLLGWFDHGNGTQAALVGCGDYMVLVFRATQVDGRNLSETFKDVRTDLMFRKARFRGACVHRGFLDRYSSVRSEIRAALRQLEGPVFIAGHSLGGALAKMAAMDIPSTRIRSVYTFGAPRVGNTRIDELIGAPLYQFIHAADLIPRLPLLMMGYRRAGDKRYITRDGRIIRAPNGLRLMGRFALSLVAWPPTVLRDHGIVNYKRALARAVRS